MNKTFAVLLAGCILFLVGCAGQEEIPSDSAAGPVQAQAGEAGDLEAGAQEELAEGVIRSDEPLSGADRMLMVEKDLVFHVDLEEEGVEGMPVGVQYYRGEPVLLSVKAYSPKRLEWIDGAYQVVSPSVLYPDSGLYLYRRDGSRELLIPGEALAECLDTEEEHNNSFIGGYTWYADEEGGCYCIPGGRDGQSEEGYLLKLNQRGELVYRTELEPGFKAETICSIGEKMYVAVSGKTDGNIPVKKVKGFDPDTGILSEEDAFVLLLERTDGHFGQGPDGLYLLMDEGIRKVNLEDGSISDYLLFAGSTYAKPAFQWKFREFRILEDGGAQILYYCDEENGVIGAVAKGLEERLSLVEGERVVVKLRAAVLSDWVKNQAAEFNKTNGLVWVELEELADSGAVDLEEYARQTNVEIAAGKGPDIVCGSLMEPYVRGLIDKGALLDLRDRMEASGIREEDYLPSAFDGWGNEKTGEDSQGIYGVNLYLNPAGVKIRRDVLERDGDIHTLISALLEREGDAFYCMTAGPEGILKMFLEGTEDLWGMVDWEEGTCDFGGGLLARMLEAAERYGYDGVHSFESLGRIQRLDSIYRFDSRAELEAEGMTMCGVLFDDGCYGAADSSGRMAVNAVSSRKDEAWAFLCFLLGTDRQEKLERRVPVNRAALEGWIRKELEEVEDGGTVSVSDTYKVGGETLQFSKTYTAADMTEERVEEYLGVLEEVRCLPFRTGPILDIIYEEAEAYFGGGRSVEDVSRIVQNRVQLYLDENRQGGRQNEKS